MTVVFGGTGFLGRRIVSALTGDAVPIRIATRHPRQTARIPAGADDSAKIETIAADVTDPASVRGALEGCTVIVNCVSLYHEHGAATFESVHVDGAATVAEAAADAGASHLVHLSGIGADPNASSRYISARGLGETAVHAAFPRATVFRPSVMFGEDDKFVTLLSGIVRRAPLIPLFGDGSTRLQPVYVGDVAAAAVKAQGQPASAGRTYELGGPEVMSYKAVLKRIGERHGRDPMLVPVPFAAWSAAARVMRPMSNPPLIEGQVALMRNDNVASAAMPGLTDFGITPTAIASVIRNV
ncbi:MAG: complex I NDUFA9 subunit family protein [Alphaproteobacteria bacterium]|nr:complex I NDUFA9 subunit family protein [Alphaproteobacteria bacterium]